MSVSELVAVYDIRFGSRCVFSGEVGGSTFRINNVKFHFHQADTICGAYYFSFTRNMGC